MSNWRRQGNRFGNEHSFIRGLPPLAGHDHIYIVARTTGTDQPLTPIGNGCLWAVSARHFGGIGLNPMAAISAPHDQPNTGIGGTA
jgi:hypothetical protein